MKQVIAWGIIVAMGAMAIGASAAADCIIVQSESMGIPLLPDWTARVSTLCGEDHIKVAYKKDRNFLVGLFAPDLNNIPDMLYSLPDFREWSIYNEKQYTREHILGASKSYSRSFIRKTDSLMLAKKINFAWDISALGEARDTIAGSPCDRLFFTGVGTSSKKDTTIFNISVDIHTAAVCEDNEPINHTYERFRERAGFDPLNHFDLGLALGRRYNAPVGEVIEKLEQMRGFPIKIDVSFEIDGWGIMDGTYSYDLDLIQITEEPVPPDTFELPSDYTAR